MTLNTSTDYSGKTQDMLIVQDGNYTGEAALVSFSYGTGLGKVIAGIQKLVQKVLLMLFTDAGSVTYDPSFGTGFMPYVRGGLLRDEADIVATFNQAILVIQERLELDASADTPDDETLESVEVTDVDVDLTQGLLKLGATLTTAADTSVVVIIPITLVTQ